MLQYATEFGVDAPKPPRDLETLRVRSMPKPGPLLPQSRAHGPAAIPIRSPWSATRRFRPKEPLRRPRCDHTAGEPAPMSRIVVPAPIARLPWQVMVPLSLLVLFGAAVLYSAAGGSMSPFAGSHIARFTMFLAMALVLRRFPRDLVKWAAYPAYGAVLVLLVLVEVLGAIGGGSQRWLNIGPLVLQPSELMKPAIVLVLASFYHSLPVGEVSNWRSLIPASWADCLPMALVLMQPDLGTALAIAFGGMVVMFLAGLPLRWFGGAAIGGLVAAPIAFFFALHDYQRRRVTTFLDPGERPARCRLSHHPVQDRDRIGRRVRQGFRQRHRRATSTICPNRTPISSSPPCRKNGA